mgnify:CR=1 FL=1
MKTNWRNFLAFILLLVTIYFNSWSLSFGIFSFDLSSFVRNHNAVEAFSRFAWLAFTAFFINFKEKIND